MLINSLRMHHEPSTPSYILEVIERLRVLHNDLRESTDVSYKRFYIFGQQWNQFVGPGVM